MRNGSMAFGQRVTRSLNASGGGDFGFGMGGTYYAPEDDGGGGSGQGSGEGDGGSGTPDLTQQINDAVAEATKGLKSNNEEILADRKKWKDNYSTLETQFNDFKKEIGAGGTADLAKVSEMMKKANDDEERELIKAADFDGLVARRLGVVTGNHKQQLDTLNNDVTTLTEQNKQLVQENRGLLIGGKIRQKAELAGVLPEAIDIAVSEGMAEFDIQKGKIIATNEDGTTRFGKDGKTPYAPEHYVEDLRERRPFMFPASEGGGSKGNSNPNLTGSKETYSLAEWQVKTSNATPDERKALIQRKSKGEIAVT